ncbi:hypothetical protein DAPPUDRAFT_242080 [Daphnia pulex]|uniref:Uncharacterized protein n=1 Tax=Daphnia pulex TaxID=6669 RepID=E9GFU0_DAPPU|nr:hypothetical protein DAPPUDRAFT_242080 [Daphnia pulex]|eukprot:EFX81700.1 hypothetical protein DAPPUDRAFT_242080 [Daphnia pulex]
MKKSSRFLFLSNRILSQVHRTPFPAPESDSRRKKMCSRDQPSSQLHGTQLDGP